MAGSLHPFCQLSTSKVCFHFVDLIFYLWLNKPENAMKASCPAVLLYPTNTVCYRQYQWTGSSYWIKIFYLRQPFLILHTGKCVLQSWKRKTENQIKLNRFSFFLIINQNSWSIHTDIYHVFSTFKILIDSCYICL